MPSAETATAAPAPPPPAGSEDHGRQRGGALLDGVLFLIGLGCVAYLLLHTSVLPAAARALAVERQARRLQAEVEALAARVEELRRQVIALKSDPWYIERTLKARLRALRPDLFPAQQPPAPAPGRAAAVPAPPSSALAPPGRTDGAGPG
ncbi:MAG: hypothetical protein KatS3mg102_0060 [Planctomycetota bacterium]|nr:MAG: hypothetical protein KatS3mg102_0060 [Planctomycetota bacterium]